MLQDASVRLGELRELTDLVDHVASEDPALAARLELEDLLDHAAEVLIARSRWSRVPLATSGRSRVHERRVVLSKYARERMLKFDAELTMIRELLESLVLRPSSLDLGARQEWCALEAGARSRTEDES